jgi:hypothetical protein
LELLGVVVQQLLDVGLDEPNLGKDPRPFQDR